MTTTSRRPLALATLAGLLAATLTPTLASPAVAADAAPVPPVLLPAGQPVTAAVDISPSGVVVGTSAAQLEGAPTGQQWTPTARGWTRRALAVPPGTTSTRVAGVTDRGEAGGSTYADPGPSVPTRWSVAGRNPVALAPSGSTAAVGAGQWLITRGDGGPIGGTASIVGRDGTTTPITGVGGGSVGGLSVAGPRTALVSSVNGIGQGATSTPVVWENGVARALPVFASYWFGAACASTVQADGSAAYSGYALNEGGDPPLVRRIGVLRGGVDGQDAPLQLPAGATRADIGDDCSARGDTLSADGWVVGHADSAAGRDAVAWRPDGTPVVPERRADETEAAAAAVSTGGGAVLRVATAGGSRLYHWRDGVRTPLTLPAGWDVAEVLELTDTGYVLANLTRVVNGTERHRPAVWRLPAS
jgi:hypothetical protein